LLCLCVQGCCGKKRIVEVTHPSSFPHGWWCTRAGPAPMSLVAGLPIEARLALASQGKTTWHPPPVFAAIGKALAMLGKYLHCILHQFSIDTLPLLQLLYEGQHLCHFSEFFLHGGTMEAIDLAFAPCHVKGSTAKNRRIFAIAITIGITPLHPGAAAIIRRVIPLPWNQSPLRPALNPRNHLLSPLPLPLLPPLCNGVPLAGQQFPAGRRLLLQR
jgi:hypothetical protein